MPKLTKAQQAEKEAARNMLRALLAPVGTERKTVYSINRHTSRSGMRRKLDFYVNLPDHSTPFYLTGLIANAMRGWYTRDRDGSLKVDGAGMDMGFSVVYGLGATLWPEGTPEPHGTRNGEPDTAGGYAIRHEWL
jgi:hypothetical protein